MRFRILAVVVAILAILGSVSSGCSGALDAPAGASEGESADDEGDEPDIVTPGKADNYYSNVAREFELRGTIEVEMTSEQFENPSERNRAVSERLTAVGLYLTAYLTDKIESHFDNMDYGGFKAMVRNYSVETEDVAPAGDERYSVEYTIDVAGPGNLLERLLQNGGEEVGGGVQFAFAMPAGATSDRESAGSRQIRNFNPDQHPGELEWVELVAEPLPDIQDAYPHYDAFMQDGVYDITHVFGYDYNEPRQDVPRARRMFSRLVEMGFQPPTSSFDQLGADSGPFVRTLETPGLTAGDEVRVEVRLYHAAMFEGERQRQHDLVLDRLRESDVFFYNGHAGPYFGLYLDGSHRADVDYQELAEVQLPRKQQIFVAQGCQTYSQYADMLYANPAKSEENLDVITTVNFGYGKKTWALFENLVRIGEEGVHMPTSYYKIVRELNTGYNDAKDVFYGAMGIDGNPQTHPYGNPDRVGAQCETDADCGDHPAGNVCADGECAVRAIAEGGCPAGTEFGYLTRSRLDRLRNRINEYLGRERRIEKGVCH